MTEETILFAVAIIAAAVIWQPAGSVDEETGEGDQAPDLLDQGAAVLDGWTGEEVDEVNSNQNLRAFLAALRLGEGTSGEFGYRTLCGGALFTSYATHPALNGWRGLPLSDSMCAGAGFGPGCVSTAAGAYQINRPTWNRVAAKLGLSDFSPASQDAAAIELIRERGAYMDVCAGRIGLAIYKVRKVWASLPGAGYGQHEVASSTFTNEYARHGGKVIA